LKNKVGMRSDWIPLRILTANVGNLIWRSRGKYNNKLCSKIVERSIKESIEELHPDVVFFQELLHPDQCIGWREANPEMVCYKFDEQAEKYQPRRLLGDEYTIAFFARSRTSISRPVGAECIAVHLDAGGIQGCDSGELLMNTGRMDVPDSNCNPEFIVSSVNADLYGLKVSLVNAHAHSRLIHCRQSAIRQIFEGDRRLPPLAHGNKSIIAGDFNFDPFRGQNDVKVIWDRFVGTPDSGCPYYYHSGIAEHDPPYPTVSNFLGKKTVDHVISDFAFGTCVTLGESPGTKRLDGGKGTDHRGVLCDLWIPPP
jgi:endonuclease/exonuclease/phosphatase family metal-dependent hydrolase